MVLGVKWDDLRLDQGAIVCLLNELVRKEDLLLPNQLHSDHWIDLVVLLIEDLLLIVCEQELLVLNPPKLLIKESDQLVPHLRQLLVVLNDRSSAKLEDIEPFLVQGHRLLSGCGRVDLHRVHNALVYDIVHKYAVVVSVVSLLVDEWQEVLLLLTVVVVGEREFYQL